MGTENRDPDQRSTTPPADPPGAEPAQGGNTFQGTVTGAPPEDLSPVLDTKGKREFPSQLGCYRLSRKLGEGGMGAVFLAEDLSLQRQVALKVMRADVASNSEAGQRFLREARSMAALKHDNIVTIYSVGEDKGIPFLAMELLKGISLDAFLKSGKPLTIKSILRIGREIARGLGVAHAKGLIHRDIKPGNIWLEAPAGRVKILDFGLARPAAEAGVITASGIMVGTPHYMSPEQGRGETMDARADLFSLGVLLYRMTTGQLPFKGTTLMAVLMAIGMEHPPSVSSLKRDVPLRFSRLIERLIAKKPNDRPSSTDEVVAELFQIERDLGRDTPGGPLSSQADSAGMVIDDVLPVGDNVRQNRDDDDQTEANRSSGAKRRPSSQTAIDDRPEVVSSSSTRRKRRRKSQEFPVKQYIVLAIGGLMLLSVIAYFINDWRKDHIRKQFEDAETNSKLKTP